MTRNRPEIKDDPPPIMGTWPRLYALVLFCHAIIIALFYLLTKMYS
ncbi:MAG: hypothetical protein KDC34_02305 [Saprospiraceae bacterium]|nr:hypothetical protein [Saprospiraceae bacterium]